MKQLLVISSYPRKGATHDSEVVGVATYTKNTLLALKKAAKQPLKITVLAEVLPHPPSFAQERKSIPDQVGNDLTMYTDEGITVKRVWRRKSLLSFVAISKAIFSERKTNHVLVALELAMFGGIVHLMPFPLFLLLLRLLNKNTTIVFHQVITDISDVHGQMNLPERGIRVKVATLLLRLFYRIVLSLCTKAIVFDQFLLEQLSTCGDKEKITVIPHGVEQFPNLPTKTDARAKLTLSQTRTIIVCFGFLAWYKGTDLLVDLYSRLPEEDRPLLILAGGPNPNHTDKVFYQKYIQDIEQKAQELGIIVTGFVPEKLIPLYYAAADICILPYRTFMSSSGPLSFVFSTKKPFLLSDNLKPVFKTEDIARIIKERDINPNDLIFSQEDFADKMKTLLSEEKLQKKICQLGEAMTVYRGWDKIGARYADTLLTG